MNMIPEGEDIRKAIKWISDERKYGNQKDIRKLIEKACVKFDLSPIDADFLTRFVMEEDKKGKA